MLAEVPTWAVIMLVLFFCTTLSLLWVYFSKIGELNKAEKRAEILNAVVQHLLEGISIAFSHDRNCTLCSSQIMHVEHSLEVAGQKISDGTKASLDRFRHRVLSVKSCRFLITELFRFPGNRMSPTRDYPAMVDDLQNTMAKELITFKEIGITEKEFQDLLQTCATLVFTETCLEIEKKLKYIENLKTTAKEELPKTGIDLAQFRVNHIPAATILGINPPKEASAE